MMLALQPSILLLDEPTSACDENSSKNVEGLIVKSGIAVIWISHDPTQIQRLQDLEQTSLIRIASILRGHPKDSHRTPASTSTFVSQSPSGIDIESQ
jgi:ABC-type phosphate transport system ATPase subunit